MCALQAIVVVPLAPSLTLADSPRGMAQRRAPRSGHGPRVAPTTPATPKLRDADATRARILATASEEFCMNGYAGVLDSSPVARRFVG